MKKVLWLISIFLLFGVVFATDISVSVREISPETTVPRNAVRFPLLAIDFSADEAGTAISEIWIRRTGLSSWFDIGNVGARTSRFQRSLRTKFGPDDVARIRFLTPVPLDPERDSQITIFGNFNFSGDGLSAGFSLENLEFVPVEISSEKNKKHWRNFRNTRLRKY